MILKKYSNRIFYFFYATVLAVVIFAAGCNNEPTNLGINFLDPDDTTGVRVLDSQTDTLIVTSSNYIHPVNTLGSRGVLVGKYQNAEANSMIKFTGISDQYSDVTVTSATLRMTYRGYFYQDPNGVTAFDIYRVNKNFNYSSVTSDSVSPSDIGNTILGTFNGSPSDSATINIPLDNQTVKDWLISAADPNYTNPNYGIYLKANSSSTTIKSFYSIGQGGNLIPNVLVIYTRNNVTDTLTLVTPESVSLCTSPIPSLSERFVTQNGIAIRNMLRFDLTKLPQNVIINQAQLEFSIDRSQSFISSDSEMKMLISMITDSTAKTDSTFGTSIQALLQTDSTRFTAVINPYVQRWASGLFPNYGISIRNISEIHNMDLFTFFNVNASDLSRRPRLKIIYTQRN